MRCYQRHDQKVPGGLLERDITEVGCRLAVIQRQLTLLDTGRVQQGATEAIGRLNGGKVQQILIPVPRRCQRQLQIEQNAIGAIGVVIGQQLLAAQLQHPRVGLDGQHANRLHGTGGRDRSVVDRANAAKATSKQPTNTGRAVGRWHAAQLPAALTHQGFQLADFHPRLHPHQPIAEPLQFGAGGHVDHHPTFQRYGLTIVAGTATAHRHHHAKFDAGTDQRNQFRLVAWLDHQISQLVGQLRHQHRAEPIEITGQPFDVDLGGDPVQLREPCLQRAMRIT